MVAHTPLAQALIEQGRAQTWLAMHLSARLGRAVYRQEVSQWALGNVTPNARTREAIASILDVAVSDLFPAHSPEPSHTPTSADAGDGTSRKAA